MPENVTEVTDTVIIITVILISSLLSFWQEKGVAHAFEKLLSEVEIKAAVIKGWERKGNYIEQIVPEDIIIFYVGDKNSCRLLDSEVKGAFCQ